MKHSISTEGNVPAHANLRYGNGFTLIEMMVVVAIVAIMAALAAPSFNDYIAKNRVKEVAEEIYGFLLQAKSESPIRDADIFVDVVAASPATTTWCLGFDTTANCDCTAGTCQVPVAGAQVTQQISSADYTNVSVGGSDISFRIPRNTANPNGTINVTSGAWGLDIVVSSQGRIRICNPNSNTMTGYESC